MGTRLAPLWGAELCWVSKQPRLTVPRYPESSGQTQLSKQLQTNDRMRAGVRTRGGWGKSLAERGSGMECGSGLWRDSVSCIHYLEVK